MTRDEFLTPETRWGYFIDADKKMIWEKQINLLLAFDSVCKKNNLRYFAFGGTLLGAIRHNGFIPWDDDIDLAMPRDDYDKLISLSPSPFNEPFFLQNAHSDEIKRGHSELRDTSSMCLMDSDFDAPYKVGVFIDIFVMDYVNEESLEQDIQRLRTMYGSIPEMPIKMVGRSKPLLAHIYNCTILPMRKFLYKILKTTKKRVKMYSLFEEECKKLNHKTNSVFLLEFAASLSKYGGAVYDSYLFEEVIYKDFEYISIPCPKEYDKILTKRYGNYLKPIKGGALHNDLFFDLKNDPNYYKKIITNASRFKKLFNSQKEKTK